MVIRRLLLALAVPLALVVSGCAGSTIPGAPVDLTEQVVLDEKALLGVEVAYKASRLAMETAVDAGALEGSAAAHAAELDNRAYQAVVAARRAYDAGNSASYDEAIANALAAVNGIMAVINGGSG